MVLVSTHSLLTVLPHRIWPYGKYLDSITVMFRCLPLFYCSQSSLVSRTFFDHKAVHYDCRLVQILNCTLKEATVLQSLKRIFSSLTQNVALVHLEWKIMYCQTQPSQLQQYGGPLDTNLG